MFIGLYNFYPSDHCSLNKKSDQFWFNVIKQLCNEVHYFLFYIDFHKEWNKIKFKRNKPPIFKSINISFGHLVTWFIPALWSGTEREEKRKPGGTLGFADNIISCFWRKFSCDFLDASSGIGIWKEENLYLIYGN